MTDCEIRNFLIHIKEELKNYVGDGVTYDDGEERAINFMDDIVIEIEIFLGERKKWWEE